MKIGEKREVTIRAREPWNDTQVDLVSGGVYRFSAPGHWIDLVIWTDADGYDSVLVQHTMESRRRMANNKWFALVGTIGMNDETAFVIGKENTWSSPESGRLFAYANDVPGYYFNNFGHLTMTVERLS